MYENRRKQAAAYDKLPPLMSLNDGWILGNVGTRFLDPESTFRPEDDQNQYS